ncbi:MoaD/ThiS family protein [Permianibacter sp. IMCC34836]|uniref:MoaD/ThiS family protein n=1 Tax=Permianibacter fluminis TaxID=2738515 RepID=UPI001552FF1C|nr:MoaD/ThiS family protein [Permianibacter fluminis]NQD37814.1 MoaD/ThiS family protein [Permianibacter fluminis]
MLRVLFFGSLAEQVGVAELQLDWVADWRTVHDVMAGLHVSHSNVAKQLDLRRGLMIAVNQRLGKISSPIADDDELAFLPPVTGG